MPDLRDVLRFDPGTRLADRDPRATPLAPGGKRFTRRAHAEQGVRLADLQERLYAEGRAGGRRAMLLVLQGVDASGKDGVVKHVVGRVHPQGVRLTSFGPPTEAEQRHDFLWRVTRALPGPGQLGTYVRSHYEDVLVPVVHGLIDSGELERRYRGINEFEAGLVDGGTVVLKCLLHLSPDEQRDRLRRRLAEPSKRWKWDGRDLDERRLWHRYAAAYQEALERCSTYAAPWYVVPADRKWYRDWAVGRLLVEALTEMAPEWPRPVLDVDALSRALDDAGPA